LKVVRSILLALAIAGLVRSASADPSRAPLVFSSGITGGLAASLPVPAQAEAATGREAFAAKADCLSWLEGCSGRTGEQATGGALSDNGSATGGNETMVQVPALPGSSSLFLSAVLSAGALHLARKARNVHVGHLPAWYHDACPERIAHAVAFDFNLADIPVCFTAEMAAADVPDNTPAFHEYMREPRSRLELQFFLPVTAPRGPPSLP